MFYDVSCENVMNVMLIGILGSNKNINQHAHCIPIWFLTRCRHWKRSCSAWGCTYSLQVSFQEITTCNQKTLRFVTCCWNWQPIQLQIKMTKRYMLVIILRGCQGPSLYQSVKYKVYMCYNVIIPVMSSLVTHTYHEHLWKLLIILYVLHAMVPIQAHDHWCPSRCL